MNILSRLRKFWYPQPAPESTVVEDPPKKHGTLHVYFVCGRKHTYPIWTTNESWYDGGWWTEFEQWYADHTNPDPYRMAGDDDAYVIMFYRQHITHFELIEDLQ